MTVLRVDMLYMEKEVRSMRIDAAERSAEVPQVMYEKKLAEVPQEQQSEHVKKAPKKKWSSCSEHWRSSSTRRKVWVKSARWCLRRVTVNRSGMCVRSCNETHSQNDCKDQEMVQPRRWAAAHLGGICDPKTQQHSQTPSKMVCVVFRIPTFTT